MIRLADYLFKYLADFGVRHVFLVTGGGSMHLNDALGKETRIQYVCNHHEQASAMAAEAYGRVTNRLGVVSVTTGPGGINAINGVFGAWTDSIPLLVISGQVKRETCMGFYDLPGLRQLGDQEVDIISMVKGITKYAELIKKPEDIRFHLEKALHLATTGRKGPCWLDIPVDIQSAMIDENNLHGFEAPREEINFDNLKFQCKELLEKIETAKRPVVLLGSGIRLADAGAELEELKKILRIPMVVSWTGVDLLPSDDPLYCGLGGSVGTRSGNFSLQNADLVIVLGSRLNIRQVSYNWKSFAKNAFVARVDIDSGELNKPISPDGMKVQADLKDFLKIFIQTSKENNFFVEIPLWLEWCKKRVNKYPVLLEKMIDAKQINPYHFIYEVFKRLNSEDIIACGDGTACVVPFQIAEIKNGQKLFTNSGCASMGFDLPAAIGAAFAYPQKRIICFAGDGSIQLNIQELQTIIHHQLPIKIFVLNNQGYLSIKLTQQAFFNSNYVGSTLESGLSFPNIVKVGEAYGFKTFKLDGFGFKDNLDEILNYSGPVLCEVMLDPRQGFEPKLSSRILEDGKMQSSSLEDMAPFLDSKELAENIIGL